MKLLSRLNFILVFTILFVCTFILSFKKYFSETIQKSEPPCYSYYSEPISTPPTVTSPELSNNLSWVFQNNISKFVDSHGTQRRDKVYLTIGIPSIKRVVKSVYLVETLEHLSNTTSANDKKHIMCVVFLCDNDSSYNQQVKQELSKYFKDDLQSGFLQVIMVDPLYYPHPSNTKVTFNDPMYRIKWRTKQVFDFNLLFRYCSQLSQYHMQIEDDVKVAQNYLLQIRSYLAAVSLKLDMEASTHLFHTISNSSEVSILKTLNSHFHSSKRWSMLDFSRLGFIGKLFQSPRMDLMATFFNLFYDEQPIDWLINYYVFLSGQHQVFQHFPSLFQHFGIKSSLNTIKDNVLKDKGFELGSKTHRKTEPPSNHLPALVFSSFPHLKLYNLKQITKSQKYFFAHNPYLIPNDFYITNTQFFYLAKLQASAQHIDVIFLTPASITSIILETGIEGVACHKHLQLHAGANVRKVLASSSSSSFQLECTDLQKLPPVTGCFSTLNVSLREVACLSISVPSSNTSSLVFFNYIQVH